MNAPKHQLQFYEFEHLTLSSENHLDTNHASSSDQYVTIIVMSDAPLLCQPLIKYRLQKGAILFCSRAHAIEFFRCNDEYVRPHFLIRNLPIHNIEDYGLLEQVGKVVVISPAVKAQAPIIDDMLELIDNHFSQSPKAISSILDRFISILQLEALQAFRLSQSSETALSKAYEDQKITKAISLIHANLSADWSTKKLASDVDMPVLEFAERFKQCLKVDPFIYVTHWRMQKFITMLDGTMLPISSILKELGFGSEERFRELFFESFGFSPEQYRKKTSH